MSCTTNNIETIANAKSAGSQIEISKKIENNDTKQFKRKHTRQNRYF